MLGGSTCINTLLTLDFSFAFISWFLQSAKQDFVYCDGHLDSKIGPPAYLPRCNGGKACQLLFCIFAEQSGRAWVDMEVRAGQGHGWRSGRGGRTCVTLRPCSPCILTISNTEIQICWCKKYKFANVRNTTMNGRVSEIFLCSQMKIQKNFRLSKVPVFVKERFDGWRCGEQGYDVSLRDI